MVKKILPWVVIGFLSVLLVAGFAMKDKMNNYLSEMMKQQASPEMTNSGEAFVDSLYNYSKNGLNYEITFLEFGATGCSACKQMEKVLDEIGEKYHQRVNVIFLNVLKPENQLLMKYYGIAAIPTQVLLNREGKEYFRHTGFISSSEISKLLNL